MAEPKDRAKRLRYAVALAGLFVVGMWVWSGAAKSADSINALFSGLAFVALVAAIFLQQRGTTPSTLGACTNTAGA